MFSVGIIGLPNAGKSTLFKALTNISVPIADYPFTTIDPYHGIVEVKDERLERIKEILKPKKTIYPTIEFIDIAGLVKGAHKGEGLGNQFLSNITEADLLLEVVRCFSINSEQEKITKEPTYNLWEKPNPERDIEIVKNEIIERDKRIIENFIKEKNKISKLKKEPEIEINVGNKIYQFLENGIYLFEKIKELPEEEKENLKILGKKLGLISLKPIIYCFNIKEKNEEINSLINKFSPAIFLNAKEEEEISELNEEEKKELDVESKNLDDLIINCYNTLELITFYTIKGGEEIRANEIKRGSDVLEAAQKLHSDFKEKFICAEILKFEDFLLTKSWQKAKESGLLKIKGKEYIVEDGDIIEFKI